MPPVFSHGDLRLYLLNLLDESPRHGYDLMQALSDRTGGTYTPSAGTIYPRLSKLEEEGLVTKVVDGRKTVYEITDAGRAEVSARAHELEGIEAGLADSVRLIADEVRGSVREAMKSLRADLAASPQSAPAQAQRDRGGARAAGSPWPPLRRCASSREQLRRTEAILGEFRATVRADVRTHLAHGGELAASAVDDLSRALDDALAALTRALR
ncbi:PadR family transcriptional regulator [Microbacterium hominis]|uniref:PadR family transcriptional regulator n=1 Tax=Microbacterium hominis TaxID=162426 RepID=UPI0007688D7F|nr:PadR family transcriptional regulator [Microbacterium hominis]KXC06578.1 PadR family transcriptional regulator [Microbacterium hominis]